jgi:hypothetical protein
MKDWSKSQKGSEYHSENVFEYVHTLTDTELNEMVARGSKKWLSAKRSGRA